MGPRTAVGCAEGTYATVGAAWRGEMSHLGCADAHHLEIPTSLVDHLEFYLLNYFKPGTHRQTLMTRAGRRAFEAIGCTQCHIPALPLTRDRRVAEVETAYDFQPVDQASGGAAKGRHDFFREQAQGAQRLLAVEGAEKKGADEVVRAGDL
jgi:CxxC motif-containing protein (DUF1111 family)